jgi:hypothetical protein
MAVLGLSWILVIDSEKVSRAQPSWQRRDASHVRTRPLSPTTIARARPVVLSELMRKASRPRWKDATAQEPMTDEEIIWRCAQRLAFEAAAREDAKKPIIIPEPQQPERSPQRVGRTHQVLH